MRRQIRFECSFPNKESFENGALIELCQEER